MQIISCNIGTRTPIVFNHRTIYTGIFKRPVSTPLYLSPDGVEGDAVTDRRVHGGPNKACYLYSKDHYPYWQQRFPKLDWHYGMFGENLTVAHLDEHHIRRGDILRIGQEVLAEVTGPREPCFKLGIRFGDQTIVRLFQSVPYCGFYVKILHPGFVSPGDTIEIIQPHAYNPSIAEEYLHKMARKNSARKKPVL